MTKLIKTDKDRKIAILSLIIALLTLTLIGLFIALIFLKKKQKNTKQKNTIDIKNNFDLHEQEMLNVETDTSLFNSISTDKITKKL